MMQPMRTLSIKTRAIAFAALAILPALLPATGARAAEIEAEIPFAGDRLTVERNDEDGMTTIRFAGRELAGNFFAAFDRVAEVQGSSIAIFYLGDGGNACGPSTLLVWQDDEGQLRQDHVFEEDCGGPAPSVSEDAITFVPYVMPGSAAIVHRWTPSSGLSVAGMMSFLPQPGSGWEDIDFADDMHPVDFFDNEAVYEAAQALLGNELEAYAMGLSVSSGFEEAGGLHVARGCMPHNCGGFESLLVVDLANRGLFAAEYDGVSYRQWPDAGAWPRGAQLAFEEFATR